MLFSTEGLHRLSMPQLVIMVINPFTPKSDQNVKFPLQSHQKAHHTIWSTVSFPLTINVLGGGLWWACHGYHDLWRWLPSRPARCRGGKWFPENRGCQKILARSRNLGNVSSESWRLVFFSGWVQKLLESQAQIFKQGPQHLGESCILPFATPCCGTHHHYC